MIKRYFIHSPYFIGEFFQYGIKQTKKQKSSINKYFFFRRITIIYYSQK